GILGGASRCNTTLHKRGPVRFGSIRGRASSARYPRQLGRRRGFLIVDRFLGGCCGLDLGLLSPSAFGHSLIVTGKLLVLISRSSQNGDRVIKTFTLAAEPSTPGWSPGLRARGQLYI